MKLARSCRPSVPSATIEPSEVTVRPMEPSRCRCPAGPRGTSRHRVPSQCLMKGCWIAGPVRSRRRHRRILQRARSERPNPPRPSTHTSSGASAANPQPRRPPHPPVGPLRPVSLECRTIRLLDHRNRFSLRCLFLQRVGWLLATWPVDVFVACLCLPFLHPTDIP
jgi:hypothetical protein